MAKAKARNNSADAVGSPESNGLPEGWARPRVSELVDLKYGKALKKTDRISGGTLVYGSNGPIGEHNTSLTRGPTIIVGRKGTVGAVNLSEHCCWPIDTTYFIDDPGGCDIRFLYYGLKTLGLEAMDTSTAIPGLSRDDVYACRIPIAPLAEQKRIVAKVEALLERVRKACERLDRVPEILKRFRQSVLAAACSGRLTADWREKHSDVESGTELLARCDSETAAYDRPKKLLRRKTVSMATSEPPESLPESWTTATVRELVACGALAYFQDGNHGSLYPRKTDFGDSGVKFLTAAQIQDGQVLLEEAPLLSTSKASKLRIGFTKPRDVLLTHNATVGRVAMMPEYDDTVILGTSVTYYRFRDTYIIPEFICYVMESHLWQTQLAVVMEQTTRNQVSVNKQVELWLPIPPIEEQKEIVQRLTRLTQFQRVIDERVSQARKLTRHLPQSVLAKAFAGELVEIEAELARREGRDYEPASVLLERIAADRAASGTKSKPTRRKKMAKQQRVTSTKPLVEVLQQAKAGMSPEELLTKAGFNQENIEDFYSELRDSVNAGQICERRNSEDEIQLTVDKQ